MKKREVDCFEKKKKRLQAVQYYRYCPAQISSKRSTLSLLIAMLTLLARFDHSIRGELQLCESAVEFPVMSHLVMLTRDAIHVAKTKREIVPESAAPAAMLFSTCLRFFTWCCNFSELSTERPTQANLMRLGFHEIIQDAMDMDPEVLHPGLMLYGTLSSYQPAKAILLTQPLMRLVLRLLDPKLEISHFLRENATTVNKTLNSQNFKICFFSGFGKLVFSCSKHRETHHQSSRTSSKLD